MEHGTRRSLDSHAKSVIDWLNDEDTNSGHGPNSPQSRERILDLIDVIQEVNEVASVTLRTAGREQTPKCYFCNNWPKGKMRKLLSEIDARMAQYPTSTCSAEMDCYGTVYIEDGFITGRRPVGEWLAAHSVSSLTNANAIDRITQCECGRYFFARFSHQLFCSAQCKRRKNQGSKTYKANRKEYMRWYYAMYQSPKQPAKKLPFDRWRTLQGNQTS